MYKFVIFAIIIILVAIKAKSIEDDEERSKDSDKLVSYVANQKPVPLDISKASKSESKEGEGKEPESALLRKVEKVYSSAPRRRYYAKRVQLEDQRLTRQWIRDMKKREEEESKE